MALTSACVILSTNEILSVKPTTLDPIKRETIPFGYRIGDTANHIVGSDINRNRRPVLSLLHGDTPDLKSGSIVLIEHDQWEAHPSIAAKGNWHQEEPWNENQLLGNQFWLAAIFRDGQFQSNLGGQAFAYGKVKIVASSQLDTKTCLAAESSNILYLGDADYFSNGMSAYQAALIKEILGDPSQFTRIRLISILLLIGSICLDLNHLRPKKKIQAAAIGVTIAIFLCFPNESPGEIRIEGVIYDPHETSRASGVLSALSDAGINSIRGDSGAKILVVAEGLYAAHKGESIVILEPGATVKIDTNTYTAATVPLGSVNQIVDARKLIINNQESDKVELMINEVHIIGTGSPAKNSVLLWQRH